LLPGGGKAQPRNRLHIESVQVGFGGGSLVEFKSGFWTPVYITVQAGPEGTPRGQLVVESVDSDEVPNRYTIPLPQLDPGERETLLAYTKPASRSSDITVQARVDDRPIAENKSPYAAMELDQQLLLAVGPEPSGLRNALRPPGKAAEEDTTV